MYFCERLLVVVVVWEQIPSDLAALWGVLWEGLFVLPLPGGFSNIPVAFGAGFVSWYEPRGYGWFSLSPHPTPAGFLPETKGKRLKWKTIEIMCIKSYIIVFLLCSSPQMGFFFGQPQGNVHVWLYKWSVGAMKCFIQNKGSVFKNNPLKYGNKASCGELSRLSR